MKKLIILILSLSATAFGETPVFHCVGTEPFWSINVSEREKLIRFSTPDERMSLRILRKRVAVGSSDYGAFILDTKYTSLTVFPSNCNDGMSDRVYTHSAVFDMGGRDVLSGCCDVDPVMTQIPY